MFAMLMLTKRRVKDVARSSSIWFSEWVCLLTWSTPHSASSSLGYQFLMGWYGFLRVPMGSWYHFFDQMNLHYSHCKTEDGLEGLVKSHEDQVLQCPLSNPKTRSALKPQLKTLFFVFSFFLGRLHRLPERLLQASSDKSREC